MAEQITTKPFLSRRQQRWAFANKKPFAKRWAKETPSFAALPERKDAGAPLHGPGGLLGAPGMGGRLRKRLKAMTRSEAASVAAHARWDKTPRKAKPPRKGRKPAKTEQERQAKQRERDEARQAERAQNRAEVLRSLNIAPDGAEALAKLRSGEQPDPAALARGGFVEAGLVEQASDGTYRMTPAGRALLSAADAGDRGRAGDTISGGRDRVSTRRQRQRAAAERKKKPKQAATGGGGKEKPKPAIDVSKRMRRINARLAQMRKRRKLPLQTTKAQTAEDRAMFAKMGGGGGSRGSGSKGGAGGKLWTRGPDGKRAPSQGQLDKMREHAGSLHRQASETYGRIRKLRDEQDATRPSWGQKLKPKYEKERQKKRDELEEEIKKLRVDHDRLNREAEFATRQHRAYEERLSKQNKTKSFTVYKSYDGTPRWLARTTTAYRDRDREIIAIKALDQDSQRMTAAKQFGPLRFWHLGRPDPLDAAQPWGPGLDVGDCDFSIQIGTTRVESGTFKSAALARRIAETATEYELSPGFFHPPNQPDAAGIFTTIRTFERSLVPTKYGRASNLFTGLTVKEQRMEPDEMERRFKAAIEQLRLPPEQAAALSAGLIQADKSAQQQGIAYKSATGMLVQKSDEPALQVYTMHDGTQGIIQNGLFVALKAAPAVTEKAMPPEFGASEEKADFAEGEMAGEEMADMGMDDAQLVAAIADAVVAKIAPMFGDMKMSELKAMLSGVATKDDTRAQEIAALKAAQDQLTARLAQLTGDQPAAPLPADVVEALKSKGPTAPNTMPAPANAVQSIAMQTLPQLYSAAPDGSWNGWQAAQIPPSQS